MNKQTIFLIKLNAKQQAFQMMIESCKEDVKKYPHKADFFKSEIERFKAKLDVTNEIIKDYLND